MRACKKCGAEIPNRAVIDGEVKLLCSRKYCLECSPWGKHNTKKLTSEAAGRSNQAVVSHRIGRKLAAIERMGGKCVVCGYDRCASALEFHHLDPAQKDPRIKAGNGISWERLCEELDKCILVCANCHREIHAGLINVSLIGIPAPVEPVSVIRERGKRRTRNCPDCGGPVVGGRCFACHQAQRRSARPSAIELEDMMRRRSVVDIAAQYGVTHRAIYKWASDYGITYRRVPRQKTMAGAR